MATREIPVNKWYVKEQEAIAIKVISNIPDLFSMDMETIKKCMFT